MSSRRKRPLGATKAAAKDVAGATAATPEASATSKSPANARALVALRIGLIAGAVGAIGYGILCGEHLAVLAKGVRICLECMGIA